MLTFGFGLGALLFVVGIITYVLAPRIGPNPIFGVRVGYSYATREVWDKTNRFGGALIALIGVGIAALSAFLDLLGVSAGSGTKWITGAMILTLLGAAGWMFVYARRLALGSSIAREVAPVKFRWAYAAPVLASFALLVALIVLTYPQLPADRVATHFDINNQPDGWSTRDGFVLGFAGLAALFVLMDLGAVIIATREPLVAFGRWGSHWVLDPARGLVYIGMAFSLVNLILIAVFLDIVSFNARGVHLFPLALILWIGILLVAVLIGLFFRLARRVSSTT
jgi:uncharacterized membrane protein